MPSINHDVAYWTRHEVVRSLPHAGDTYVPFTHAVLLRIVDVAPIVVVRWDLEHAGSSELLAVTRLLNWNSSTPGDHYASAMEHVK